uniref:Uncharacterized protein n=1 Tax=Utricularia reniformis TaxID=192314 RepID=A0A1Y0B1G5_9LAMI|nr:hypothetical protein AEK19_MT1008 [Utricularia reniformis]ART31231.1 hypothetical protein AEK19_MT1008 [Utricularia reniformis]
MKNDKNHEINLFDHLRTTSGISVRLPNGCEAPITGSVRISEGISLSDVLYVPSFQHNGIGSGSQFRIDE